LDYFDIIYKRLYTKFDRLFFESEFAPIAPQLVKEALEKGILEKSEGAIIFNGKKYGIDTRVFFNSLGFPTYEGKELGLAEKEFTEFGPIDKCIHVVSSEQTSFFKVTFKVEELLDEKKYKNKQLHLVYGWVRLKHGKMSSRSGFVVEGPWLIDEAKRKIIDTFHCTDEIAEKLSVASIKYSILKNTIQGEIVFDFDESISIEGNSAPYLIYTYVRTCSILSKDSSVSFTPPTQVNEEELLLFRMIHSYPEIVHSAAQKFSPNFIATYLYNLAQQYNLFYQKCPILKADKKTKQFRLLLTKTVGQIIKNGLYILGIETVEKM
jgi:arginyl-tRNA synthetase